MIRVKNLMSTMRLQPERHKNRGDDAPKQRQLKAVWSYQNKLCFKKIFRQYEQRHPATQLYSLAP